MKTGSLKIMENYPLKEHTTFGVGGPARYFAVVESEDNVVEALDVAKRRDLPVLVLGGGSNVLISDAGFPGIAIQVRIKGFRNRIEGEDCIVYAGAGEDWQDFADRCVNSDWQGVECLVGIPGTVGAAPVQNIGAYGQDVSETIVGVRAIGMDTGEAVIFGNEECAFAYRKSIFNSAFAGRYIITGVTFRLKQNGTPAIRYRELQKRVEEGGTATLHQVKDAVIAIRDAKGLLVRKGHTSFMSGGSFFKNPVVSADIVKEIEGLVQKTGGCSNWAWPIESGEVKLSAACLIQRAGFNPGFRKGNVGISPNHTLIIINFGGASSQEVADFAREVQVKVKALFGVFLRPEIRLIGYPSSFFEEVDE
jgi:UDP-N-acetylmuramate dehydrogenase